jgi:hypothetical protein
VSASTAGRRDVRAPVPVEQRVAAKLLRALLASRWPLPRQWSACVVCVVPDATDRVVSRQELAADFRGAGDDRSAHEVLARTVPYGCVLTWVVEDSRERAFAGLVVVNLRALR